MTKASSLVLHKARVFGDKEYLDAAVNAAEVVWKRGLLRRVGLCHGISGNAYVFLSLNQLTGNEEHIYRGKAFACFLLNRAQKLISQGEMHGGDTPYSLFEALGGMAYLFPDMVDPRQAKFPAYDLWESANIHNYGSVVFSSVTVVITVKRK